MLPFRLIAAIQEWQILRFARIALGLLGVAAVLIGLMNFIVGPVWTAGVFSGLLSVLLVGWPDPLFQVLMWIELSAPVVVGIVVGQPMRRPA